MSTDRFGANLATKVERARDRFENATYRILAHQQGIDVLLAEAVEADPACAGVWALRGLCQTLLAREAPLHSARIYLSSAISALDLAPSSEDEQALVAALQVAVHGGLRRAAGILEARLSLSPQLLIFAKLAHALRFMSSDGDQLTTGVETVLRYGHPDADGMGFMIGCLAFGHEERGDFARAEALGLEAIQRQPDDAWAMHAISHVHEMTGRYEKGLDFIERHRPTWGSCNNFALHMAWHAALFELERGDVDRAIQIYDEEVWPRASEDFRDISNAVSLLYRLESRGVPLGSRWRSVAEAAAVHANDRTYTFACLHHLIALLSAGRTAEAAVLTAAMERPAGPGNDQEQVLRRLGRPLARLMANASQRRRISIDVTSLLDALSGLGGSAAQRDLFLQVLASDASAAGDKQGLEAILMFRSRLKTEDHFARQALDQIRRNFLITA